MTEGGQYLIPVVHVPRILRERHKCFRDEIIIIIIIIIIIVVVVVVVVVGREVVKLVSIPHLSD